MSDTSPKPRLDRLRLFVTAMGELLDDGPGEEQILRQGAELLASLVRHDDWLPAAYATPDPDRYQQYLLHCDSRSRFCVVSFVWGPGQSTPIHDHTIWGLVGMMRGSEIAQSYERVGEKVILRGAPIRLSPGDVETLSPRAGDIHQVRNASTVDPSISIHVYGADIGAVQRSVFSVGGLIKPFISGYSNAHLPNIWGISK